MSKYNVRVLPHNNGNKYVFVTRKRTKGFSDEELIEALDELEADIAKSNEEQFKVVNTKIFAVDLRSGLDFCSRKYGVSTDTIERKAAELFPHLTIGQLTK